MWFPNLGMGSGGLQKNYRKKSMVHVDRPYNSYDLPICTILLQTSRKNSPGQLYLAYSIHMCLQLDGCLYHCAIPIGDSPVRCWLDFIADYLFDSLRLVYQS